MFLRSTISQNWRGELVKLIKGDDEKEAFSIIDKLKTRKANCSSCWVNRRVCGEDTLLHLALKSNMLNLAESLIGIIKRGGPINIKGEGGKTCLKLAVEGYIEAESDDNLVALNEPEDWSKIIKLLIKKRADSSMWDKDYESPLDLVKKSGYGSLLKIFGLKTESSC